VSVDLESARPDHEGLVLTLYPSRRVDRVWSPLDAFLYNFQVMNPIMGFALAFLTALMIYPGGNWLLATAIAVGFCAAEALVYAYLAACMPRSGGEYYFQARILSTATGSIFCFSAIVLGGTLWVAVTGWCAAQLAVGPLFFTLGVALDSQGLIAAARWAQSPWGVLVLSVVVIVWSALVVILGMPTYARWQRWFSVAAGVLLIPVLIALLKAGDLGSLPVYREAMSQAVALGYSPDTGTFLAQTLAIIPLASYMLVYAGWSTQQAGETRDASRLPAQVFIILGAMSTAAVFSVLLGTLVAHKFGAETLGAGAFLFFEHHGQMPLPTVPFLWWVDISPAARVFGVVVALFLNALFWMNAPNPTLAASRVLMAMSSDRILPRWVGHLNATTKAPVKAITLFSVMCALPCAAYAFTSYWRLTLNTVALVNILAFAVTCATGAAFPFVRRELYRETAASRYEFLGVPVITIAGTAFVAFTAWIVARYTVDFGLSLGLGLVVPIIATLGLYAASFGVYLVSGLYRRARAGTELEVWFTESPLE
jgi:amino acid transporter